jgi:hypothetical protein
MERVSGFTTNQAKRNIQMTMKDWAEKLDGFLKFNDYNVLKDAGKITHEIAVSLAEKEYGKYHIIQDRNYESDFDKEIKKLQAKSSKTKLKNVKK